MGAVARDAGVDGSARRPRRRHQAGEQSGAGRHQSQQPDQSVVYYGNDIRPPSTVNNPHGTNTPPVFDSINNVQNVYLPPGAGTNFSVTVMGYRVNVNAVTAQTNNVVQDYALVISCGNGQVPTVMTVSGTPVPSATPPSVVSNPTGDQQITYSSQTSSGSGNTATSFAELLNQFAGANSPLLGTNTIVFSPSPITPEGFGPTNWQVTAGRPTNGIFMSSPTLTLVFPTRRLSRSTRTRPIRTRSPFRAWAFLPARSAMPRARRTLILYVTTDPVNDQSESGGDFQLRRRHADWRAAWRPI